MIKFIHKKRLEKDPGEKKIIIYYNLSDIFLGIALFVLVIFFSVNYFINAKNGMSNNCFFNKENAVESSDISL